MAAKLHKGHMTGSRDIQNGWILSGQPSYNEPYWEKPCVCHIRGRAVNVCGSTNTERSGSLVNACDHL